MISGRRVSKSDALVEAYGSIDELNSFTGLLNSSCNHAIINSELSIIQNLLFNAGSIVASDGFDRKAGYPKITEVHIRFLENAIDAHDALLPVLRNFIIPGASLHNAYAHVCRTVCRRAERRICGLSIQNEEISLILVFLNRLSDYFFTIARVMSLSEGMDDLKWDQDPKLAL